MDVDEIEEIGRMNKHLSTFKKMYALLGEKSRRRAAKTRFERLTFHHLARYVRARDGGKCLSCGSTSHLSAHHLQPRSEFPELFWRENNLATLCGFCHVRIHGVENFPYLSREAVQAHYEECERRGLDPIQSRVPMRVVAA